MAIAKVGVWTDPPDSGSYGAISSHLSAFVKQVTDRQDMIADRDAAPSLAVGTYISHGGTLYQVQTDAYAVTGSASVGKNYIKVAASGDTLVLSFITDKSGYSYNPIYNGWYDISENQVLPYLVCYNGSGYSSHDLDLLSGYIDGHAYDLVVRSDVDLSLLFSGSASGTFPKVLVLDGTWDASSYIDLDAHDVETFEGFGTIDASIVIGSTSKLITCGSEFKLMRGITITSSATQTEATAIVIYGTGTLENISISGMNTKTIGVYGYGDCRLIGCDISECDIGSYTTGRADCWFSSCRIGCYGNLQGLSTSGCYAIGCNIGFSLLYKMSGCEGYGNTDKNFDTCGYLSGCNANGNSTSSYGFKDCSYVSASYATGCTTNWSGCTYVDYDSTNCNQQWTYGDSGANVTTSGWVLPAGAYQLIKTSSATVYLDVYDGSSWIQSSGTMSTTSAFPGIVFSDGVNTRLRSTSGTQAVAWRKKP